MMVNPKYDDVHKVFLQSMMSRAIVSFRGARQILKNAALKMGFSISASESDLGELITEINRKITLLGMELKIVSSEQTGEKYVALINIVDDSSAMEKIDHIYGMKERELFRLLIEAFVRDDIYGSMSLMDALHIPVAGMSPGEIQDFVDRLVSDQWILEVDEGGRLAPAPRCIAEFDMYFRGNFEGYVQICTLCDNVVFCGWKCSQCFAISHNHCFKRFNSRGNACNKCPTCKKNVEGQESPDTDEETPQPKRKAGPKNGVMSNTPGTSHSSTPRETQGRRKRHNAE